MRKPKIGSYNACHVVCHVQAERTHKEAIPSSEPTHDSISCDVYSTIGTMQQIVVECSPSTLRVHNSIMP